MNSEQTTMIGDEAVIKMMLTDIKEQIRHISVRLDKHIDEENSNLKEVQKDVSRLYTSVEGHKIKLTAFTAVIAIAFTAAVNWALGFFGGK